MVALDADLFQLHKKTFAGSRCLGLDQVWAGEQQSPTPLALPVCSCIKLCLVTLLLGCPWLISVAQRRDISPLKAAMSSPLIHGHMTASHMDPWICFYEAVRRAHEKFVGQQPNTKMLWSHEAYSRPWRSKTNALKGWFHFISLYCIERSAVNLTVTMSQAHYPAHSEGSEGRTVMNWFESSEPTLTIVYCLNGLCCLWFRVSCVFRAHVNHCSPPQAYQLCWLWAWGDCCRNMWPSSALLCKNSLQVKPTCFVIGKYSLELCVNRSSTSILPRIKKKKKNT